MAVATEELPFSARYSLPAQVADNLGEVSWETVAQLSCDFQAKSEHKGSEVKKVIKELQMTRLLLMDRIKNSTREGGRIDPQLLVDIVRLLQRCEEVTQQYEIDLKDFSSFLYLVSEKLKKEKLAFHQGGRGLRGIVPIKEELAGYKAKSEPSGGKKKGRGK